MHLISLCGLVCALSSVFAPSPPEKCPWNSRLHKRSCHEDAIGGGSSGRLAPSKQEDDDEQRPLKDPNECSLQVEQQRQDINVAAIASRGGADAPAVRNVHLLYVHIHGHINHYYHWVHDALLTFYPVFNALAPKRVVVWHGLSFGHFTPLFEAVYNLKVSYYYNQATDCTTVK